MSKDAQALLPPLDNWRVQFLRLTSFPGPEKLPGSTNWWLESAGEKPESTTVRAKEGLQVQEGPVENGSLRLTVGPLRIDWVLGPPPPEESDPSPRIDVGPLPATLGAFRGMLKRWLTSPTCPPSARLAFGAVLIQPAETLTDANRLMAAYLVESVRIDPAKSRELLYRINRCRPSQSIADRRIINRLNTWSVLMIKRFLVPLLGEANPKVVSLSQGPLLQLELDINTQDDADAPIPQELLPTAFDELVDLGCEIATRGDIP